MRIFHNIDQSVERYKWLDLRKGKATASNFGKIMANFGKPFGEPAKKYAMKIALESILEHRIDDDYSNEFMQRGIELEPIARDQYELDTFSKVDNGGFMEYGFAGGSADGLVGEDGLIEIKSVIYTTHFQRWIKGDYDSAYKWQIQGNMWVYDRKWCDFVSYCPEFPTSKNLYVFRVDRDEKMIEQLEERMVEFQQLTELYKEKIS